MPCPCQYIITFYSSMFVAVWQCLCLHLDCNHLIIFLSIRFQDHGLTFKMRTSSLFEISKNSIYPLKITLSIICLQLLYVLELTAHLVILFLRIGSDLLSTSLIFFQIIVSELSDYQVYAYSVRPRVGPCPPLPPSPPP
jgi:hypothetical protein